MIEINFEVMILDFIIFKLIHFQVITVKNHSFCDPKIPFPCSEYLTSSRHDAGSDMCLRVSVVYVRYQLTIKIVVHVHHLEWSIWIAVLHWWTIGVVTIRPVVSTLHILQVKQIDHFFIVGVKIGLEKQHHQS